MLVGAPPRPHVVAKALHDVDLAIAPDFLGHHDDFDDGTLEWDELAPHVRNLEIAKVAHVMEQFGWR
jgi:hypothetical protein